MRLHNSSLVGAGQNRRSSVILAVFAHFFSQLGNDLKHVADDSVRRILEDLRVGVLIYSDDNFG